jgi:hypothetical protein
MMMTNKKRKTKTKIEERTFALNHILAQFSSFPYNTLSSSLCVIVCYQAMDRSVSFFCSMQDTETEDE